MQLSSNKWSEELAEWQVDLHDKLQSVKGQEEDVKSLWARVRDLSRTEWQTAGPQAVAKHEPSPLQLE